MPSVLFVVRRVICPNPVLITQRECMLLVSDFYINLSDLLVYWSICKTHSNGVCQSVLVLCWFRRLLSSVWVSGTLSERLSRASDVKSVALTSRYVFAVYYGWNRVYSDLTFPYCPQPNPSPSDGYPTGSVPTTKTSMCVRKKCSPKKTRWWYSKRPLSRGCPSLQIDCPTLIVSEETRMTDTVLRQFTC